MKKYLVIIVIAILTLLFCSCGKFDIICSIDENNVAELRMDVNISKEDLTRNNITYITRTINEIERHMQTNGYTAQSSRNSDTYSLSFTKRKECQSAQEALDTLLGFMSDDASPFSYVEGGYSESFFNDIYNINAELNLTSIISSDFMDSLTDSHREKIEDALDEFSATVQFDLYGNTAEYTGALLDSANSEELKLDTPISISRAVSIDHPANIQEHSSLNKRLDEISLQKERYKLLLIIIGALAGLLMIILTIHYIKRKLSKLYYY